MINKGIIIFKHVAWEPINISLQLPFMLNKPQLDWGFNPWNKEMKNPIVLMFVHNCWYVGKSRNNQWVTNVKELLMKSPVRLSDW